MCFETQRSPEEQEQDCRCCREEAVAASIKLDDLLAAFAPVETTSTARRHCSAISLSWLSDTAVAVVLKQEHAGEVSRRLFVFSCTGCATELQLDKDEVCHVSAELDGCVVLGQQTWSLVRDVPVAVQRVCFSASCNLFIISKGDSETCPEYSEFPCLCGNCLGMQDSSALVPFFHACSMDCCPGVLIFPCPVAIQSVLYLPDRAR